MLGKLSLVVSKARPVAASRHRWRRMMFHSALHVVYVNGLPFLARLMYRTAEHIPIRRSKKSFIQVLERVFRLYRKSRIHYRTLIPNSYQFETTLAAKVTYNSTAEHVPASERNNRVIHEHTRETFHRLPSRKQRSMLVLIKSTKCLN